MVSSPAAASLSLSLHGLEKGCRLCPLANHPSVNHPPSGTVASPNKEEEESHCHIEGRDDTRAIDRRFRSNQSSAHLSCKKASHTRRFTHER